MPANFFQVLPEFRDVRHESDVRTARGFKKRFSRTWRRCAFGVKFFQRDSDFASVT